MVKNKILDIKIIFKNIKNIFFSNQLLFYKNKKTILKNCSKKTAIKQFINLLKSVTYKINSLV